MKGFKNYLEKEAEQEKAVQAVHVKIREWCELNRTMRVIGSRPRKYAQWRSLNGNVLENVLEYRVERGLMVFYTRTSDLGISAFSGMIICRLDRLTGRTASLREVLLGTKNHNDSIRLVWERK